MKVNRKAKFFRITPAWAGKSDKHQRARSWLGDHPRVGGEKPMTGTQSGIFTGSPPRGRGKAEMAQLKLDNAGITPAWAGKSQHRSTLLSLTGDHPRVGGEKITAIEVMFLSLGSPPRGRGKEFESMPQTFAQRITPAWAGKSATAVLVDSEARDHPRVGGEKIVLLIQTSPPKGSPPRGRGKD